MVFAETLTVDHLLTNRKYEPRMRNLDNEPIRRLNFDHVTPLLRS